MSASVNIRTYTDYWMKLFEIFQAHPEQEFVVPCSTEKEANRVRLEWYQARCALQKSEHMTMDAATYAEFGHPNLNRKECIIKKLEDGSFNVCFVYKEESNVAKLLAASLKEKE